MEEPFVTVAKIQVPIDPNVNGETTAAAEADAITITDHDTAATADGTLETT